MLRKHRISISADTIFGDAGNDTLRGGASDDILLGGDDDDFVLGQGNNDRLWCLDGKDVILGGLGGDLLLGDEGADILLGGAGDDTNMAASTLTPRSTTATQANYQVVTTGSVTTVTDLTGTNGVDTLLEIEFINFATGDDLLL